MTVENPEYDAGNVLARHPVRHSFPVKNSGDAPLTIKDVKPGCGCTVAQFTRTPIPPGGVGEVTLEIDKSSMGKFTGHADVITDDAQTPSLDLSLSYRGIVLLAVEPERMPLHKLVVGIPGEGPEVRLTAVNPARPLVIEKAVSDRPELAAVVRLIEPDRMYGVSLHYTGTLKAGESVSGVVKVTTGYPEQPEVVIPYNGIILNRVRLIPETLDFGTIKRLELRNTPGMIEQSVVVDNPGGQGAKFKLGEIEIPEGVLYKIETVTLLEGQRYVLKFRVNSSLPAGPISGRIRIHTNDPVLKVVDLPVTGTFE